MLSIINSFSYLVENGFFDNDEMRYKSLLSVLR